MLYTVHSEDAAVCCCSCTAVSAPAATPACCSLLQYTNPRGASQKKGIVQCRDFFWKLLESVSILIWILSFFLNYQTCLRSGHCQTCTIVSLGNPPFFSVTNIQALTEDMGSVFLLFVYPPEKIAKSGPELLLLKMHALPLSWSNRLFKLSPNTNTDYVCKL